MIKALKNGTLCLALPVSAVFHFGRTREEGCSLSAAPLWARAPKATLWAGGQSTRRVSPRRGGIVPTAGAAGPVPAARLRVRWEGGCRAQGGKASSSRAQRRRTENARLKEKVLVLFVAKRLFPLLGETKVSCPCNQRQVVFFCPLASLTA